MMFFPHFTDDAYVARTSETADRFNADGNKSVSLLFAGKYPLQSYGAY